MKYISGYGLVPIPSLEIVKSLGASCRHATSINCFVLFPIHIDVGCWQLDVCWNNCTSDLAYMKHEELDSKTDYSGQGILLSEYPLKMKNSGFEPACCALRCNHFSTDL